MLRNLKPYFWWGLLVRVACAPFLFQWFHPDERQTFEFAHFHAHGSLHPFMESEIHLRNQTLPWLFSHVIRLCDALGIAHPWAYLAVTHLLIGSMSWITLYLLIERLRARCPDRDIAVNRVGYFFALFWAFPFLYSRALLESLSLPFTLLLLLAMERGWAGRAGFFAGLAAIIRYPSALWAAGAALLALRERWEPMAWIVGALGFAAAIVLGGIADWSSYEGFLSSASTYWAFNRPDGPVSTMFGHDSLAVYWRWFEFLFTPWLAPFFIVIAIYSLVHCPTLLWFSVPYILGHLWTPHREPRFMLPLTPVLCLAIAEAGLRGRFRWIWDRIRSHAWVHRTALALVIFHVALNFLWYPFQLWGQWESAQGVLIRQNSALAGYPTHLLALGDPPIDMLIPASARWTDRSCEWHRPPLADEVSARLWILAEQNPAPGCTQIEPPYPYDLSNPTLKRLLRVRTAELWQCPPDQIARICPNGIRENPPGRPQTRLQKSE